MTDADDAAFIAERMPLSEVPGVPGIRLHLATSASGLNRRLGDNAPPPYWAYRWGGGLALAAYLMAQPEAVRGRTVLDLGTGSGLVAIAAALAGAARVDAVDIDAHALAALALNAAANGVTIHAHRGDWLDDAPFDAGIVLVGDLFYDPVTARRVTAYLGRCRDAGAEVLIGDPYRAPLPLDRLALLADGEVEELQSQLRRAGVFRLR